ncbi:MAG: adenylate/guanylate cyclase domain-containing protein [Proteobacteria bacterium]|nr:adenylate/guanylate cyclase domain-containing protein [Pseudomonadota bacterium]
MAAAQSSSLAFRIRTLRLATGLILFSYVTTHLLNHALGLVSIEAMEAGRLWFLAFWRQPPIALVLYGALLTHFLLALWAIYSRRRLLRMRAGEATQLILELMVVPLLAEHVVGTRVASAFHGLDDKYTYVLLAMWHFKPSQAAWQSTALLVAWTHGCIGLYFWLRLKPWWRRATPLLYAAALLVPVLALLGFAVAGRDASRLAADGEWLRQTLASLDLPGRAASATLTKAIYGVNATIAALLALTLLARLARDIVERRRGLVRLTYPGGREIEIAPGLSVLEASQTNGIPHASVCGGRGRCSTCRIRVAQGLERMPPPSPAEAAVLKRVSAAPNVRLACQLRPQHDITVTPLLPPTASPRDAQQRPAHMQGMEAEIAILFADIRGYTKLSERKLPYDIVFLLNRYFAAMGQAVEGAGGRVDKFIGDGVMALFGIDGNRARGCRQALAAARAMSASLEALNQTLQHDLTEPLRIGIGIHVGPAIVGEMGYARAVSLTAIGDAVNTASRMETLTKDYGAELVVSEDVAKAAELDLSAFALHQAEIRGREERLAIRVVPRARDLPG